LLIDVFGFVSRGVKRGGYGNALHGEVCAGDSPIGCIVSLPNITCWQARMVPERAAAFSFTLTMLRPSANACEGAAFRSKANCASSPTVREYGVKDLEGAPVVVRERIEVAGLDSSRDVRKLIVRHG
jgi:hypothetical protein